VSDLSHGLAPKMKPISRRRSAIVCALDIGTSKIVCAIARLKPRPPQDVLPRRTHAVEVLGIGHAQAQGMKSGAVTDIVAAEEMLRFDLENEKETILNYQQRIRQADAMGEFALGEVLRKIIEQEQDHLLDLADALGVDVPRIN